MTFSWPDEKTVIRRLRVRASGLDPQAARLRLGFAFETADLRPAGLPPAAVLCVRRLRDPCPGGLDLRHPGQPASPRWERAVQEALAELARAAARPAREMVPAGAQAVLFADRAELIACLARDWLDGCLHEHWWWRELLRDPDPARCVARAWAEAPAYVPAALEQLASCGRAVEFVRALGGPAARRVLAAVLEFFDLPEARPTLEGPPPGTPGLEPPAAVAPTPPECAAACTPPWRPHVPESRSAGLGAVEQALLGIGLALRRAPSSVRRPEFSADLRAWCASLLPSPWRPGAPPAAPPDTPTVGTSNRSEAAAPAQAGGPPLPGGRAEPTGPDRASAVGSGPSIDLPRLPEQIRSSSAAHAPARVASPEHLPAREEPRPPEQLFIPAAFLPGKESAAAPDTPWSEPLAGTWFETGFGGVFYLVNLALFLGLYADFTRPRTPGIDLQIWDFLALAGRDLVGAELEADPAWEWLARLAGRAADQQPGADFVPPDSWRMPPDWLEPFAGPDEWTWSRRAGRLRLDHRAGFRVVDVPAAGEAAAQLEDEIRPYQGLTGRPRRARSGSSIAKPNEGPPALEAWLAWLLPYVRERLRLALGLRASAEVGGVLCARPARVYLTESHLDVTFSLAGLPVAVRLSGLDRNPGWVPAASRYVTFRYEN